MKRLDKVWNVWKDIDKTYDEYNIKMKAKTGKGIKRLEFLAKILKYTGIADDDMTRFKAMFSNEIKTYNNEELSRYDDLINLVSDYLSVLDLCLPDENNHQVYTINENLTITEIRTAIASHLEQTAKAIQELDVNKMDLFTPNRNKSRDEKKEENVPQFITPPFNIRDYYIVKGKSNCTVKNLFNKGKLSNYFELDEKGISYSCAPSINEDYVYIDDRASFFNYLYQISGNPIGSNSFQKAVYLFLIDLFNQVKRGESSFAFPYVFISTRLLEETSACYRVGKLSFRKNRLIKLDLRGKTCKDLTNREFVNSEEIYKTVTTNTGIDYTVCLVGNLE